MLREGEGLPERGVASDVEEEQGGEEEDGEAADDDARDGSTRKAGLAWLVGRYCNDCASCACGASF